MKLIPGAWEQPPWVPDLMKKYWEGEEGKKEF